jgi:hypothetical protein
MEILRLLEKHRCVADYEVEEFRSWGTGGSYRLTINIVDGSMVFAREYVDDEERSYSYHWQDEARNLIRRWDNAPYHPDLHTYPHHVHVREKILACMPPDLENVLSSIESQMSNPGLANASDTSHEKDKSP